MLAKCVNPLCFSPFRYLREGKLFRRDNEEVPSGIARTSPEYFWLCGSCSKRMTLKINEHGEVLPVAIHATIPGIRTAIDVTIREQGYRISLNLVEPVSPNVESRLPAADRNHRALPAITSALPESKPEIQSH